MCGDFSSVTETYPLTKVKCIGGAVLGDGPLLGDIGLYCQLAIELNQAVEYFGGNGGAGYINNEGRVEGCRVGVKTKVKAPRILFYFELTGNERKEKSSYRTTR